MAWVLMCNTKLLRWDVNRHHIYRTALQSTRTEAASFFSEADPTSGVIPDYKGAMSWIISFSVTPCNLDRSRFLSWKQTTAPLLVCLSPWSRVSFVTACSCFTHKVRACVRAQTCAHKLRACIRPLCGECFLGCLLLPSERTREPSWDLVEDHSKQTKYAKFKASFAPAGLKRNSEVERSLKRSWVKNIMCKKKTEKRKQISQWLLAAHVKGLTDCLRQKKFALESLS